jgi:hypothetical protein
MRWVYTLVLAFAALLLWIFSWRLWRHSNLPAKAFCGSELCGERNVRKIFIRFKQEAIAIEKKSHRTWQLTQPFHWPVNLFALEKFFKTLAFEKAIPSKAEIILEKSDGTTLTLRAKERDGGLFFETALSKILKQGVAFWCERRLFLQKPSEINQIDLIFHQTQQKFSLQRKGERWEFLNPIAIEADNEVVQKFLEHITAWEVAPFRDKNLPKNNKNSGDSKDAIVELKNFEMTVIIGDVRQRQLRIHLKRKVFDTVSQRDVYLGCLSDGEAYFFAPLNDTFDHPLQSLCHQSLFPEIHSVALSYRGRKLFLSRNEAGEWNAFKLLERETALHLLENFDEKVVLLYLSLIRPLDVMEKSALGMEWDSEKLILEINETLKFELGVVKNEAYLVPVDKNYALKIENNPMAKLIEILEKE